MSRYSCAAPAVANRDVRGGMGVMYRPHTHDMDLRVLPKIPRWVCMGGWVGVDEDVGVSGGGVCV
jgi:hypothetical protein